MSDLESVQLKLEFYRCLLKLQNINKKTENVQRVIKDAESDYDKSASKTLELAEKMAQFSAIVEEYSTGLEQAADKLEPSYGTETIKQMVAEQAKRYDSAMQLFAYLLRDSKMME